MNYTSYNYTPYSNSLENKTSVSRVLKRNSDLTENPIGTNTEPIYINCDKVCQIDFIIILFDAGSFCENNSTDWDCGLDKLEENISSKIYLVFLRAKPFSFLSWSLLKTKVII